MTLGASPPQLLPPAPGWEATEYTAMNQESQPHRGRQLKLSRNFTCKKL